MRVLLASAQYCLRRSLQRTHSPSHFFSSRLPRRLESTSANAPKSSLPKDVASPKTPPSTLESSNSTASTSSKALSRILTTLLIPVRAYGRVQQRRPYLTQVVSSMTIYILGDLSAQNLTSYSANTTFLASYDPFQTIRAAIIGAGISLPVYHWFIYLGNSPHFAITLSPSLFRALSHRLPSLASFQPRIQSGLSLTSRVIANQLLFTPVFLSYFFSAHALLTPLVTPAPAVSALPSPAQLAEKLAQTVPRGFVNSWKVWPAVTAVSLALVPPQFRAVFAGAVAIGWQTYLGLLNLRAGERAVRDEEGDGAEEENQERGKEDDVRVRDSVNAVQREGDEKATQREGRIAVAV